MISCAGAIWLVAVKTLHPYIRVGTFVATDKQISGYSFQIRRRESMLCFMAGINNWVHA
jgi:hypothetical protein